MANLMHLVVGWGEVGKALGKVLGDCQHHDIKGRSNWNGSYVDVVHICIPFTNFRDFKMAVEPFQDLAELVIVHSSTPVGTCDKLGFVHSPIAGVHPHLEKGIRTFVKYFGGKMAKDAAKIFSDLGLKVKVFKDARTTEAMKLWSTTQYGRMIMLEKEIYKWCQKNNLNFADVYTRSNKDYNAGYTELGMPQVVRPYLKHVDGPIGGHCVNENCKLLKVKL